MKQAHDLERAVSVLPASAEGTAGIKTVRLFTPDAGGTWVLYEYDPSSRIAFGLCDLGLGFAELGSVSIAELETVRGALGLPVEVDLHWSGTLADGYKSIGEAVPSWLE